VPSKQTPPSQTVRCCQTDTWGSLGGDKTAKASLGVTIGLAAEASVTSSIFFVEVRAGVSMELQGARNKGEGIGIINTIYATTAADKPAVGGSIVFTGATLYYSYYAEVGGKSAKSTEADNTSARGSDVGDSGVIEHKVKIGKESSIRIFKDEEWLIGGKKDSAENLSNINL